LAASGFVRDFNRFSRDDKTNARGRSAVQIRGAADAFMGI
jgi:hypothetical protein